MVFVQLSLTEVAVTVQAFKVGDFLMETEEAEAAEAVKPSFLMIVTTEKVRMTARTKAITFLMLFSMVLFLLEVKRRLCLFVRYNLALFHKYCKPNFITKTSTL